MINGIVSRLAIFSFIGWLAACQGVSPTGASNPVAGVIWDVGAGRAVTRDELLQAALGAHFLLLGETHDNPHHHRIQAELLRDLLAAGARPALAMEQMDAEQQPAIDGTLMHAETTSDAVADAGHFNRKSWDWPQYEPLIATAVEAHLPILALNLSRGEARQVAAAGFNTLGTARVARLGLDTTWNAARDVIMGREIANGHCDKLPNNLLPGMVRAQRARDAVMADALLAGTATINVAIVGRGHARRDVGVPLYLAARAPHAKVISIGLTEVMPGSENQSVDHVDESNGRQFDYLWFTLPAHRDDPCRDLAFPAAR